MADGPNLYLYCNNDPINFVDLWGLCGKKTGGGCWWLWDIPKRNFINTLKNFPSIIWQEATGTFYWPINHPEESIMFLLFGELSAANMKYYAPFGNNPVVYRRGTFSGGSIIKK
jgi:hypothetical protein